MPRKGYCQVNITIPETWRDELDQAARIASLEQRKNLSYLDLIRFSIQEKYNLTYPNEEEKA